MATKKKLAVLGGGTGSLATVWALTTLPDWQDRYDITVYQMGWRLGGKGASGRNASHGQRIEEHGLHVWAGFYDNAFRMMREVYEAWEIAPENPIQSWRDAFKPQNHVIVEEFIRGRWEHWQIDWPPAPGEPGDPEDNVLDVWGYILKILDWLVDYLGDSDLYDGRADTHGGATALWRALTGAGALFAAHLPGVLRAFDPTQLIRAARDFARQLDRDVFRHARMDHMRLIALLEAIKREVEDEFEDEFNDHVAARRLYYLMDMSMATIKGLLLDGVIFRGWDSIDYWEWSDWMRRWGASEYTLNGVLARGVYDYIFGYPNGNTHFARAGAGTAIHGSLRLVFTYRGAMFYFMQAGMGDIVFSPFYEALKARGVKFKFFQKVENLGLDASRTQIERITMTRQATLKSGNEEDYDPLVVVKGFPCWPSEPLYEQLVEGDALRDGGVNLESNWADWSGDGMYDLERGVDFDEVVLGIPCTSFPHMAKELMEASEPFEQMVYAIASTQTQAVQLWFDSDATALGAPDRPAIVTAYADPINTWSDMTHLLPREEWTGTSEPKYVAYFCGPMEDAVHIPDFSDHDFPARELARVRQTAITWLSSNAGHIWEQSGTRTNPAGLNWELLHGPGQGLAKMNAQYFRANIDPSERYILSAPATVQLRMRANGTAFKNLTITGDWVYTSLSAGCIECCAMAGLHAAEALSGHRFHMSDRGYENSTEHGE